MHAVCRILRRIEPPAQEHGNRERYAAAGSSKTLGLHSSGGCLNHGIRDRKCKASARALLYAPWTVTATMAMKTEQHHGLSQGDEYASDHWVEIAGESPHTTPLHDFNGFGYMSPSHMPIDSVHIRQQQHHSYFVPQPLHPLNIPQWPSQLTNPSETSPPSQTPTVRPLAPATTIPALQPARTSSVTPAPEQKPYPPQPTARKTLTDNDRRRMCQYHEDNPSVKQTEIGG